MATRKINRKRIPRLFIEKKLTNRTVNLNANQTHYLRQVLRLQSGDSLVLFNGLGDEKFAVIETLTRTSSKVQITGSAKAIPSSPLQLHLLQSIIKAEAMDLIIQKSVELGVKSISPVLSNFSVVKLDQNRTKRRLAHWQKISRSACEQSGRHCPPLINVPQKFSEALTAVPSNTTRIALHPSTSNTLQDISHAFDQLTELHILIGPEGGLSPSELDEASSVGFHIISLGPRTLRAETAAIAACTLAQFLWGDLSV